MPFNRNGTLQGSLGVPLPALTQWDIVEAQAKRAEPVFEELLGQQPKATCFITMIPG